MNKGLRGIIRRRGHHSDMQRLGPLGGVLIGQSIVWTCAEGFLPWNFVVEDGRAIPRSKFPILHAMYRDSGYPYGAGDGASTFNVRNKNGKVGVALDNQGGTDAGILTVANTLGATGGEQDHLLLSGESGIAPHGHGVNDPTHDHDLLQRRTGGSTLGFGTGRLGKTNSGGTIADDDTNVNNRATGISIVAAVAANAGSPHNNLQPYILEITAVRAA
jgi:microcystin-dependent protein